MKIRITLLVVIQALFTGLRAQTSYDGNLVMFPTVPPVSPSSQIDAVQIGYQVMDKNMGGSNNVGIGHMSQHFNTTGNRNTSLGAFSLFNFAPTPGAPNQDRNVALGYQSLYSAVNVSDMTAAGANALQFYTNGGANTAVGSYALQMDLVGTQNTALGHNAMSLNSNAGNQNTAIGTEALWQVNGGVRNTAIGSHALQYAGSVNDNFAAGFEAMHWNNSSDRNVAIGRKTMYNFAGPGNDNIGIGSQALFGYNYTNKANNVVIGHQASEWHTGGDNNIAIGYKAAQMLVTSGISALGEASELVCVGAYAGDSYENVQAGFGLVAVGTWACRKNYVDQGNTAFGAEAILSGAASILGYNVRTCVGAFTDATLADNSGALGFGAISNAGNKVRLGNTNVTVCEYNGFQEITSDARVKDDVKENVPGLAFIMRLRPVVYDLRADKVETFLRESITAESREEHTKKVPMQNKIVRKQTGLIAQEVEQACKETGFDFTGLYTPSSEKDNYALAYDQFVVPLTKAAQEQQQNIEEQEQRLRRLQAQLNELIEKK